MKFSAVILAGGKSSRMGQDKAWLPCGDGSLLARQIAMVRELNPENVCVSGKAGTDYAALGVPVLTDEFPDAGPLAGIAAALTAAHAPLVLTLAVDMPAMTNTLLRQLLERCAPAIGIVPRVDNRLEPLAAVYPKTAAPLAVELLEGSSRAVRDFAARCQREGLVTTHDVEPGDWSCFANWNSPADLPNP